MLANSLADSLRLTIKITTEIEGNSTPLSKSNKDFSSHNTIVMDNELRESVRI